MKKKVAWVLAGLLMVLSLILASCSPAETGEEEEVAPPGEEEVVPPAEEEEEVVGEKEGMVKISLTKLDGTPVEKWLKEPEYGGEFVMAGVPNVYYFDEISGHIYYSPTLFLTHDPLLQGDWTRATIGTGEAKYLYVHHPPLDKIAGALAESWEMPEMGTFIFHIRHGVRFQNKPPVNGRIMDADDVVFNLRRIWGTPQTSHGSGYPFLIDMENLENSIYATDKWTVVVKTLPERAGPMFQMAGAHLAIQPPEAIELYGDMQDWENACGTGPFMLVDFVPDSSVTFARNPLYWEMDPLMPENRLPYLDGVKWLFITDLSTQLSGLRTGKIDWLPYLQWEDANQIMKSNPDIKWVEFPISGAEAIFWRVDKPELPFDDLNVRRALTMAVDRESIVRDYYKGKAEILAWPILPIPEHMNMYTPLDELPESVQELYQYNPEKARQLLAEAGYPDGFKTEIVCHATNVDLLSIVKAQWEDVGVELELDVKEYGAYTSMGLGRTHKQCYLGGTHAAGPWWFNRLKVDQMWNYGNVNDPVIEERAVEVQAAYFEPEKKAQLMKDIVPYILDQCWLLPMPSRYGYNMWQPWIENYNGELQVGHMASYLSFPKYIWYNQNLKNK